MISSENKKHVQERLDLVKSDLQQCCCDLLQLSLLVPSAPWVGGNMLMTSCNVTNTSLV